MVEEDNMIALAWMKSMAKISCGDVTRMRGTRH